MRLTLKNEFVLIALLELLLIFLIAIGVEGLPAPLPLLRLVLGVVFVLFIPGYTLQATLFAQAQTLDWPERIALSFGLSIAIIPPLALILDALPWGVRLWPIVVAEGTFVLFFSTIALFRRLWQAEDDRVQVAIEITPRAWWSVQDRINRILYLVLALAFATACIAALAIIVLPKPGTFFTEFYILGSDGLAENYPRETVLGEPVSVTMGITNREGASVDYWAQVRNGDQILGQVGPLQLETGETVEMPISFAPTETGEDVEITISLFRDGQTGPYRSLRLWMSVECAQ